ncbi:hypothetical protein L195_g043952 [Trifolium pratense]|uniref:Uncharacterized protein n=1 Tax=Trifolium pratense TaxID=57577 RepID=A0A2K3MAP3_TRIPR|nr:hypothetical protein L195_g043952 [Trifolium pratense]
MFQNVAVSTVFWCKFSRARRDDIEFLDFDREELETAVEAMDGGR